MKASLITLAIAAGAAYGSPILTTRQSSESSNGLGSTLNTASDNVLKGLREILLAGGDGTAGDPNADESIGALVPVLTQNLQNGGESLTDGDLLKAVDDILAARGSSKRQSSESSNGLGFTLNTASDNALKGLREILLAGGDGTAGDPNADESIGALVPALTQNLQNDGESLSDGELLKAVDDILAGRGSSKRQSPDSSNGLGFTLNTASDNVLKGLREILLAGGDGTASDPNADESIGALVPALTQNLQNGGDDLSNGDVLKAVNDILAGRGQ